MHRRPLVLPRRGLSPTHSDAASRRWRRARGPGCDLRPWPCTRYRIGGGSAVRMTEHSRFRCIDGRWYYLDAV
ncbi:hypothetical protein C7E18_22680 [Stenotrophomonas maltophilia]|nr:hypothetical protein C7E18_22680 [Stenotrophomonas maltophilia]